MLTDAELLGQWRAGDKVAGKALFERHYASVLGFFRNKVGTDSADLVQETFAACVAGRDRIREGSSVRAYLFGIAHNVLKSHLRARYRGERVLDFEAVSVRDLSPGPSEIVVRKNEERLLLEALRTIAVDDQILLELRYWEGLKTREIADVLGIPHATVRSRLRRAHEKLEYEMARLESGPILQSTLTRLEEWAEGCRVAARK